MTLWPPLLLDYYPRDLFHEHYVKVSRRLVRCNIPLELHTLIFDTLERFVVSTMFLSHDPPSGTDRGAPDPALADIRAANRFSSDEAFALSVRCFLKGLRGMFEPQKPSPATNSSATTTPARVAPALRPTRRARTQ
jgi:hypothetical protein